VNDAPVRFAGERVHISPAQKTFFLLLQIVDAGGISPVVGQIIKLNGPGVLLAAVDQELFFVPLALKRHARQLLVEHQGDNGRHQENQQQGIASLRIPAMAPGSWLH
jgi:hypothetical protein